MDRQYSGADELLTAYQQEVEALSKSFASALRDVAEARGPAEAQRFVLASTATALRTLADSVANALRDVGTERPEFAENAERFRGGLGKKADAFREIVRT